MRDVTPFRVVDVPCIAVSVSWRAKKPSVSQ
jgi:hypothetical protein